MTGALLVPRFARWSLLGAGAGVLLLSLRFSWLVGADVVRFRALHATEETTLPPRKRPLLSPEEAIAQAAQVGSKRTSTAGSATGAPSTTEASVDDPPRTPELRTLLVQSGPARSEVFVNGTRLGETPFAGQWSCAEGDDVRVQIVPRHGLPLVRHVRCGGSTLLVGSAEKGR